MLSQLIGLYKEAPLLVSVAVLFLVSTPIVLGVIRSRDKRYVERVHERKHLREMQHKREELRAKVLASQQRRREQAAERRSEK